MLGIMALLGLAKLRPARPEVNFPVKGRHGNSADRILNAAGFPNAIVQRAVFRDHPLRRRIIVRWRDTNKIEDKDGVLLRRANQRRTKGLREQGVKGYPSERTDGIARQAGQDITG